MKHPEELFRVPGVPVNFEIVDAFEAHLVNNRLAQAALQLLPKIVYSRVPRLKYSRFPYWRFAAERNWILVSKDADFANMHAKRPATEPMRPRVLWVRLGNCRRAELLKAFGGAWPAIVQGFESGEGLLELR